MKLTQTEGPFCGVSAGAPQPPPRALARVAMGRVAGPEMPTTHEEAAVAGGQRCGGGSGPGKRILP